MTTVDRTAIGRRAEAAVSRFLVDKGYRIVGMNWRTRTCEIDIVARLEGTVYFVEVKYRKSDKNGMSLEYVDQRKIKQMKFAASQWCYQNQWKGQRCLSVAGVSGDNLDVEYIENVY